MTVAGSLGLPLAVAVGSNLDNLGVGLSYGIGRRRVTVPHGLLVAGLTTAFTATAMVAGAAGTRWVPPSLAVRGGGLLIVVVGVVSAVRAVARARAGRPAPAGVVPGAAGAGAAAAGAAGAVPYREVLAVAVGLSLNNVAEGIGAGAAGISLVATTVLCGLCSFLFVAGGVQVGRFGGARSLGRAGPYAAAAVLVAVGVKLCAP